MAPRGPTKTRDYDYSNIGKAGRRTGITLKEGKRDEHGMEEVDGIFSSPEKSPIKENGFESSESVGSDGGSDGMSMDEGNGPDPADFLNGLNGGRGTYLPPPVARSPMKTGLTGSPRRTPGLHSSQSPQRDIPSSSPSDGKGLGSAKGERRRDISPLTNRSVNAAPSLNHLNSARNRGKKMPEETAPVSFSDSDANGDENGDSYEQVQNNYEDGFNAVEDDSLLGDNTEDINPEDAEEESPIVTAPEVARRGRPKAAPKPTKGVKSLATRSPATAQPNIAENEGSAQKRKRPGRPPKAQNEPGDEAEVQRPAKKAKKSETKTREPEPTGNPDLDKVVENYANRTGPLRGRSLYILKREAPTDDSATHTRSGRVSVRPLAYWKNERCVFGDGEASEGQRYPMSTIKEIIRTEEMQPEKSKRRSKKSKSRKGKDDESDDEDHQFRDPYEEDGGVLHGYIRKWDPDTQAATAEEEVLDIAYAPSGIETRDVKGAKFRFAKLLSSPFIGSGIVDLSPGGVKKPKNSKKMHMIFYIVHGRVQVDISGVQFSAGKGCVFQVPRGNYYSFANTYKKEARLFFTQGCVPSPGGDESAPGSASKTDALDDDSMTPVNRPKKAGRPKGKQKAGGA